MKRPDISTINIKDILNLQEGQYFERKSAKIDVKKVAIALIAFANADGGLIAIGVHDGKIEGISGQGSIKTNDFIQCKITHCTPAVRANERFLEVVNSKGQKDHILLIQVEPSRKTVHKTMADEVYLRVGDESIKLNHEQRLNIEYDKGERLFEEQIATHCSIRDLDKDVLKNYKEAVHYSGENLIDPLYARGFIHETQNEPELTVAAVLLFAKHPTRFFPSARVRFIRYEGSKEEVGTEMNVIK
jgi:ATP-dependent DNA helicase RecG